jgi:hypothetical protein
MGRVLSRFTPGALAADLIDFAAKEIVPSNASAGGGPPNRTTLPALNIRLHGIVMASHLRRPIALTVINESVRFALSLRTNLGSEAISTF